MEILNIMQCTNLGGMEQASLRLMKGLQDKGHSCRVLSLNPISTLGPLLEEANIPAEGLKYLGMGGWRSFPYLCKKLKSIDAEIVVMTGHNLLAIIALIYFKKKTSRILAMHFHHKGVKPVWQWRLIYEVARKVFHSITFPSDYVRDEAISICPTIKNMSYTIRNPIKVLPLPAKLKHDQAKELLSISPNKQAVGNAGWLIPRKRFDIFLGVAQKVLTIKPNVIFVIAGEGSEGKALRQLSDDLGISEHLIWLGWQKNLDTFYTSLDVLLFNSDWDAMGQTPLEAMAHGVPVVASLLNGGLGEIITTKEEGCLYSTHDIEGMANSVLKILEGKKPHMGIIGYERVRDLCDSNRCIEQFENLMRNKSLTSSRVKQGVK